ncbi:hypothetical protein NDU88_009703 [Pleurodeles waltl]|uniref:Uncharacterized protein n=1 Tax=Pleurodeles waltl TaxID=8319 RepID=A0AAV7RX04_PLEWA|nr:hypothetical protein NDU88_009703 [Pleurodeles waltl]
MRCGQVPEACCGVTDCARGEREVAPGAALVGASDLQRSSCCAGSARPHSALGTETQWSRWGARRPGGETTRWGGKKCGTYRFIGRLE